MVVVHRAYGMRFVIFLDDHESAHVHVFGDREAKINLAGREGLPELVWNNGMSGADLRRAMRVIGEHQDEFLARWRATHG